MGRDDEGGKALVDFGVNCIAHDAENIETGEDRFSEFYILREGNGRIIAAANRVSGGNDGATGLEGSDNAGFGDGNGLLLHGFVDGGSVIIWLVVIFTAFLLEVGIKRWK